MSARDLRTRIAGAALLVLLGAGLLTWVRDYRMSPTKPASVPLEARAIDGQPITETVDLRNGNVHMQIPIRAVHQKPTAPRSGH